MLSHKKKIAFFFPSFHVGGVEKVFITYANKLIEDDYYEVLIFVCKKEGELLSLVNTSITVVSLSVLDFVGYLYCIILKHILLMS